MSILLQQDLGNIPVSFYRNMKSHVAESMTISRIMRGICSDYYKDAVQRLRFFKKQGDINAANEIKCCLHAVTFCGIYEGRRKADLCKRYNNLMVIDIDKLNDEEMGRVKTCLEQDDYVAAFWISPSGNGWKGLVGLEYKGGENENLISKHHTAFIQLQGYLKNEYNIELDSSGKDITRLCFMSWCPELIVKPVSNRFMVDLDKQKVCKHAGIQREEMPGLRIMSVSQHINWNLLDGKKYEFKTENWNRKVADRLYKYLKKNGISITTGYEDWVRVAFAIAGTFHPVYGRRLFMRLCELDGTLHDEVKSEKLIFSAYMNRSGNCDFGTILFLASKKGFIH
jgi:hypothetical protein